MEQEGEHVDVEHLNNAAIALYNPETNEQEREEINRFLTEFFKRKDIFMFIRDIISSNSHMKTKFLAINAFKNFVSTSWEVVPPDSRQDLRQYMWNKIFVEKNSFSNEINTKIIETIITISKYEYPQFWPSFIKDLVSVSSQSIENCSTALNCIDIFSQEISEFAENSLTSVRAAEMLNSFTEELQSVIELIQKSLSSENEKLIKQGLKTFASLVRWIDAQFFFQSDLLNQLCETFLDNKAYSELVISILGEIVSLNYISEEFYVNLGPIFSTIINKLQAIHDENEGKFFNDKKIRSLLAITLTSFLSQYYEAVETQEYSQPIVLFHEWILQLTGQIDEDEIEAQENNSSNYVDSLIQYWCDLARRIYSEFRNSESLVRELYEQFLPAIRRALIVRIPPPYEFRDVEEEDGFQSHCVYFKNKSGDLFNSAKEAFSLLTKLDINDTVAALNEALQSVNENGFERLDLINSACWGFGAIVGYLSEQSNRTFVSNFLDYFISLFDQTNDSRLDEQQQLHSRRAVGMGACFISVQAHKFLFRDDQLFSNIINWMLALLQHSDEDIKAFAIQCLQLLSATNKDQMTSKQKNKSGDQSDMSLLEQILLNFQNYYSSLSESSLTALFTLTGKLIHNFSDDKIKQQMFTITSNFLNTPLHEILPLDSKIDPNVTHGLILLIQCNIALATTLGTFYVHYFLSIFDLLNEAFATLTSVIVQNTGADVYIVKSARTASDAIITLLERTIYYCNISLSSRNEILHDRLFPICMKTILPSFVNTPPIAKSPKVLKLFGTLSVKSRNDFSQNFKSVLENIYGPVSQMISQDFESYENIRLDFYDFILTITRNCIDLILELPSEELESFVEVVKYGVKHPRNDVSEKSHIILSEFVSNIKNKLKNDQETLTQFTGGIAIPLLMFTFEIMTDTSHKSSFINQVSLIKTILSLPAIPEMATQIFDNLCEMFPDQSPESIGALIEKMINSLNESFVTFNDVLKDFLVSVKHLLPQDPDLVAARRKEALEKTKEFFKQIEESRPASMEGIQDDL